MRRTLISREIDKEYLSRSLTHKMPQKKGEFARLARICASCAFSVDAQQATKIEYLKTPRPMALPFSDAARVGNILYLPVR